MMSVTGATTNIAAFRKKVLDEGIIALTGERRNGDTTVRLICSGAQARACRR